MNSNEPHADAAFEAALDYLYSFINFEQRRQDRYMEAKLDSTRPRRFMDALGAPYQDFPSIHIAGTKGKGSVAALCAFSLRAAGYKVGLYTSPHLQDFRERIRILTADDADGRISQSAFVSLIEQIKSIEDNFPDVTWFEILTAVAFLHFAHQQVDVAVVEVGLGGRLDATNVVTPLVSVITSLSIDHTKFLGNTISQIAYEKGGIIKPGVPVVTAPQLPEAMAKLEEIVQERHSPLTIVGESWQFKGGAEQPGLSQELIVIRSPDAGFVPDDTLFTLPLTGDHQLENGTVALAALQQARPSLSRLNLDAVKEGMASVQWNGRLQMIHAGDEQTPMLLVDCAHNRDSALKLKEALLHHYTYERLHLVFGAPADKDIPGMLDHLLPIMDTVITTTASHPRSATPDEIAALCRERGMEAAPVEHMADALKMAWETAVPGDLICVTGSIMVVGDLLNQWERLQSQLRANKQIPQQEP